MCCEGVIDISKKSIQNTRHYEFIFSGKRYRLKSTKSIDELHKLIELAKEYLKDQIENKSADDSSILVALLNSIDDRLIMEEHYKLLQTKYLLCSKQNDDMSRRLVSLEKRLLKSEKSIDRLNRKSAFLLNKLNCYEAENENSFDSSSGFSSRDNIDRNKLNTKAKHKIKFSKKKLSKEAEATPFEELYDICLSEKGKLKPLIDENSMTFIPSEELNNKVLMKPELSLFDYILQNEIER